MSTPCNNGVSIPTLEIDPCKGDRTDAACVVDETVYIEFLLPVNPTQKQINQAVYSSLVSQKGEVDSIDNRLFTVEEEVRVATNTTNVALTASDLTTVYSSATIGFKVHAFSIVAGGKIYEKTATGWCEYSATITT